MKQISVLIVEDDVMVMDINRRFVLATEGFTVTGLASSGVEALRILEEKNIDLVILDIFMPELDGIQTLHSIRERKMDVDIIIVTASHEMEAVREVMRFGAFDYIVKPFTFERFKSALESYRHFWITDRKALNQEEIDSMLTRSRRKRMATTLPKGLSPHKMEMIIELLKKEAAPLSADETASRSGISRVTARRYLEYLVASGRASVTPLYREVGRPINKYRLLI